MMYMRFFFFIIIRRIFFFILFFFYGMKFASFFLLLLLMGFFSAVRGFDLLKEFFRYIIGIEVKPRNGIKLDELGELGSSWENEKLE